jgi:hypothetical protein
MIFITRREFNLGLEDFQIPTSPARVFLFKKIDLVNSL